MATGQRFVYPTCCFHLKVTNMFATADWSLIYTATNTSTPSWRHHGSNESTAADSYDYYYTTNITINGSRHVLRYDSTYDLYSRGYCYDGDPIDEDQLTNEPFCVAKSYWVWSVTPTHRSNMILVPR